MLPNSVLEKNTEVRKKIGMKLIFFKQKKKEGKIGAYQNFTLVSWSATTQLFNVVNVVYVAQYINCKNKT